MDPLSEVLTQLSSQHSFFGGLKAGGDWAVRFPAPEGVKFNVLVRGLAGWPWKEKQSRYGCKQATVSCYPVDAPC